MDLYINGTGIICGAGNNINAPLSLSVSAELPLYYRADEPDYKGIIPPMQLRRMSKAVRMSIAAASTSIRELDATTVQAISVGTSLGCLADTELFLGKMVTQNEQMLTPTSFIQSTHNTVAGQIALLMGCKGKNITFSHRGHSFEHSIIDASLYLCEHPDALVIGGGIDELTPTAIGLLTEASVFRRGPIGGESFSQTEQPGAVGGEGVAFFAMSAHRLHPDALKLRKLEMFTETNCDNAIAKIAALLHREAFQADLVLTGESGDPRWDLFYKQLGEIAGNNATVHRFKHFSGEYATATAIALGILADASLRNDWQHLPGTKNGRPQKILMVNNYLNYYSCWLLENDN